VRSVFGGSYQQFEMFVIDQSVDDQTYDALAPFVGDARFHYIRNHKPGVGAASSRNMGIAMSQGEIIAILDDDVTAPSDWMANIVTEFDADPDLQFICGKLTAPPFDWRTQYVPTFDPESTSEPLTKWTMPTFAAGANFSMRRALFDRVGGYDEFCGPGSRLGASDDGDLSFRIMRSGAKWKACSNIEVIHTYGFRQLTDGAALQSKDGKTVVGPPGKASRIDRFNKGPWKDVVGYRDPQGEVEKPHGEWNVVELAVQGDHVWQWVNGKLANEGTHANPSSGKILFQSEGAEIFFRNMSIAPLL